MPRAFGPDRFERARTYWRWTPLLAVLLSVHYVRRKAAVLAAFRAAPATPLEQRRFERELYASLGAARALGARPVLPRWTALLRPLVPSLLAALAVAGAVAWASRPTPRAMEEEIGEHLAVYSEVLFRRKVLDVVEALVQRVPILDEPERVAALKDATAAARRDLEDALAEERAAVRALLGARDAALGPSIESALLAPVEQRGDDVIQSFADLNRSLERAGVPVQILPTIAVDRCLSFVEALPEDPEIAAAGRDLGDCEATVLVPYAVHRRSEYHFGDVAYPVYFVRRLGGLPVVEMALGLTYERGLGSLVYVDRIRRYAIENVLPALVEGGRSMLFPQWNRSVTQIEREGAVAVRKSLAAMYSEAEITALRTYALRVAEREEFVARASIRQELLGRGHREQGASDVGGLRGFDALTSLLEPVEGEEGRAPAPEAPPFVDKLVSRLLDAIAAHEVQHQAHDRQGRSATSGARATLDPALHDPALHDAEEAFRRGVLDETASYLVELALGAGVRHITLTQLASFGLNVGHRGREYYAARIIFHMMDAAQSRKEGAPEVAYAPESSERFVACFRRLAALEEEHLGVLAVEGYRAVVGFAMPSAGAGGWGARDAAEKSP